MQGKSGSALWQNFYQGAAWGGAFASVSSGIECFNNYKTYGAWKTDIGLLNELSAYKEQVARIYINQKWPDITIKDLSVVEPKYMTKTPDRKIPNGETLFDKNTGELIGQNGFPLRSRINKDTFHNGWTPQTTMYHELMHRQFGSSEIMAYSKTLDKAGYLHSSFQHICNSYVNLWKETKGQPLSNRIYWKVWNLLPQRF